MSENQSRVTIAESYRGIPPCFEDKQFITIDCSKNQCKTREEKPDKKMEKKTGKENRVKPSESRFYVQRKVKSK